MKNLLAFLLAAGILSACDSRNLVVGDDGGDTVTPDASGIPVTLAQQLNSATYDPVAETLTLNITGLDAPLSTANFIRDATLDIASGDGTTNYQAYRIQTTTDNRYYLAYFAAGSDVSAGAAGTELEFGSIFGGTTYDRLNTSAIPTAGSAVYHSGYAGIISATPIIGLDRPTRVSGDAFFSVNLTEGLVEGSITNRDYVDAVDGSGQISVLVLSDLDLLVTSLSGAEFFGDVLIGLQDVGDYGGVLAGIAANTEPGTVGGTSPAEVAGVLVFDPFATSGFTEYGVFVAPVCGGSSASPSCP